MRAGKENLRTALLAADIINISADAITVAKSFARQRFIAPDDRLTATEVDDDVPYSTRFTTP